MHSIDLQSRLKPRVLDNLLEIYVVLDFFYLLALNLEVFGQTLTFSVLYIRVSFDHSLGVVNLFV